MALGSLQPEERKHLILSVGTHRGSRPLSPVEVSVLLSRAVADGDSLSDCAETLQVTTTQLGRFLALEKIPSDMQHLVDWGGGSGAVAFTAAFELSRLEQADERRAAMQSVLEHRLSSSEARQLVQLRRRSRRPVADCLGSVLQMRPQVEVRHVVIGAIRSAKLKEQLRTWNQAERDRMLAGILGGPLRAAGATGRLGLDRFTLVGGVELGSCLRARGASQLEQDVNDALERSAVR